MMSPAMRCTKAGSKLFLFTLLALASALARAQGAGMFDEYEPNSAEMMGRDNEARWRVALGGGLALDPNFQGSDKYRLHPAIFVFAGYGRFFIGLGGVGVNFIRQP